MGVPTTIAGWPECPRCFWEKIEGGLSFERWWNIAWTSRKRKVCDKHKVEMAAFLLRRENVA